MGMFNDSSVLTRGYGIIHRILTRGFGKKYDPGGGVIPTWRHKEYNIQIFVAILKKDSKIIKFFSPVNYIKVKNISLNSKIYSEKVLNLKVISKINSEKLINILDQI